MAGKEFYLQLPFMNTNFYFHQKGKPLIDWNHGLAFKRKYNFQIFDGVNLDERHLKPVPRLHNSGDFFSELIRYAEHEERKLLLSDPNADQSPEICLKELKLLRDEQGLWSMNRILIGRNKKEESTAEKGKGAIDGKEDEDKVESQPSTSTSAQPEESEPPTKILKS